ncbi:MAG: TraR/DksA family transcriptional regulator [Rhizobiaceae bacterium]
MSVDIELAVNLLNEKQKELEEFSELSQESRQTVELDQQSVGRLSRMDAMQQQAMAKAQERNRQLDLQRIEMAFRRIKDGDYGYCADCDEEIPSGRLKVDPMAERCVKCA